MTGKRARPFVALCLLVTALMLVSSVFNLGARRTGASSHPEAPLISQDPAADNTDFYMFVSPDKPDTVTIIACFYPGQDPAGGPNFYRFGDDVFYDINVDNNGDAVQDLIYRFDFATDVQNPGTFLYNTGPIESLDSPNYNLRQFYGITEFRDGGSNQLVEGLLVPPANVGAASTPDYEALSNSAIYSIPTDNGDIRVFAGQSDDPFWVDLGIFDLLTLRGAGDAPDDLAGFNVLTIALQIPIAELTHSGAVPEGADSPDAVIGGWSTTNRFSTTVIDATGSRIGSGDLVQVSRLGMPLVNEVVAPIGAKDVFNASQPVNDAQFLPAVTDPEFARLLNAIYGIEVPPAPRNDLVQIFLTGVPGLNQPPDVVPSEMLRLNVAIPPTEIGGDDFSDLGVAGGDLAGFPNGRRLQDEVVEVVARAAAGILYGPDGVVLDSEFNVEPNNAISDGVDGNDVPFRDEFPYVGLAHAGTDTTGLGGVAGGAEEPDEDQATAEPDEDQATAEPDEETAADTLEVDLEEIEDSGISGTAELVTDEEGNTTVTIQVDGATGDHPVHIHQGTCEDLEPNPEYPLNPIDEDGFSETVVEVSLDDLLASPHAINAHLSNEEIGVYVACGNIEE